MELFFERHYDHAIEKVWRALTMPEALEQWLMRNDFEPVVGRACTFHFCPEEDEPGGEESVVHVTVEALDPPRFMQWRWRNEAEANPTTVTFELLPRDGGTLLRLRHTGDASPFLAERLGAGWPAKLDALASALAARSPD
jgi:uncharacterized protein YndB with AHSA1/START domain